LNPSSRAAMRLEDLFLEFEDEEEEWEEFEEEEEEWEEEEEF